MVIKLDHEEFTVFSTREPELTDCEAAAMAAPSASRLPSPHITWERAGPPGPRVGSSGFRLLLTPVTAGFPTPRPPHGLPAEISQHPSLIPFLAFIRISWCHKKKSYPLLNTGGYKARSSGLMGALIREQALPVSKGCTKHRDGSGDGNTNTEGRSLPSRNWPSLKKYR